MKCSTGNVLLFSAAAVTAAGLVASSVLSTEQDPISPTRGVLYAWGTVLTAAATAVAVSCGRRLRRTFR